MTPNFSPEVLHFANALESTLNTLEAQWQTPKEPKRWLNVQTQTELDDLDDFFTQWEDDLSRLIGNVLEHIENLDKTDWLLSSIDGFFQTGFEQKRQLQHARFTDERFAAIINETLSLVSLQVQQTLEDFRHFQQSITPSADVNWQADNSLDLNFQFVDTSSLEELSLTQTAEDALADLLSIKSIFGFFAKVALFFVLGLLLLIVIGKFI